ncbi:alpha/beta fold hydrolase [Pseudoroseicyclus aestuarii]|uniref:Pimeloyl-ACP methyl ester carboxylesterase n=1 Tax=Pseudoroseicyclus aestuarii TaxID=1795041 RepID=A0A318SQH7_9RHOB|nr:alpha/beta hydrolase [Pseudoroseicyclus aestuarii]PYE83933.1 pimeloyl-ACP methyl ester carboxylesterase [Pseudoroseicyclus aestuarii]
MTDYLTTPQGRRIAYASTEGEGPGILFLGGFRSDMEGTKAQYLQRWAEEAGRGFTRFDYSGHGASEGLFEEGCIGDWAEDAAAVLEMTEGPQILVGSSMGGWIALLLARARPERIAGLALIAAAPDFTESFWTELDAAGQERLMTEGAVERDEGWGDPYPVTRRLIEDGRAQSVLDRPLPLPFPVRLMQGTEDEAVPTAWALRLLEHATSPDLRLTLVSGADHRFSSPDCLELVSAAVDEVTRRAD